MVHWVWVGQVFKLVLNFERKKLRGVGGGFWNVGSKKYKGF